MSDLDRIEALANAATPGPWTIEREEIDNEDGVLDGDPIGFPSRVGPIVLWEHAAGDDNVDRVEADVAFIVAMRDEAADLVAELRDARASLAEAREIATRNAADCAHLRQSAIALSVERDAAIAERDIANCRYIDERNRADRLEHEVERLRTAAAAERADVVAWLARQVDSLDAKPLGSDDVTYGARLMCEDAIDAITQGAHVGAANGGDHG